MAIVFIPVTLPSDLAGQTNGKLGPCLTRPVYFPGTGSLDLHKIAADVFECFNTACFAETGFKLTSTGCGRTFQRQYDVFMERYTDSYLPIRNVTTSKRTYMGKTWYLRRGMSPVAVPGTSNHGWYIANDIAVFVGGKVVGITSVPIVWKWVQDNAESFGLSWEGARPGQPGWEPWHLRYVAGDAIPQRVLDMQAFFAGHA